MSGGYITMNLFLIKERALALLKIYINVTVVWGHLLTWKLSLQQVQ
jgi:hypothetical protein